MSASKSKQITERGRTFAKGGAGNRMFKDQAAGPAKPAMTGKAPTAAPGAKRAIGGPPIGGHSVSLPAKAGHTAPPRKGR